MHATARLWPGGPGRAVLATLLLAGVVGGCGGRRPPSLTDRFVRQAADDAELPELLLPAPDAPAEMVAVPLGETAGAGVPNAAQPPERPSPATIETEDLHLKGALTELQRQLTPEAHRAVAEEYRRLGVFDLAYDHLTSALALAPQDAAAWDARARVWRDWGLPAIGLGDAARAVYFAPASAAAHNTFGTLLFALGQLDEAQARFDIAIQLDPTAAWVLNNLCYTALMRGDATLARRRCEDALAQEGSLRTARNNLALVDAALGRVDDARRGFTDDRGPAAGFYNMGLVYLARREYDRAAQEFDAASRASPELTEAFARAREARRLAGVNGRGGGGRERPRDD